MTFGRWLLIHSFSIFLVGSLVLGYFYREELRLEDAYHQLLSIKPEPSMLTGDEQQDVVASTETIPPSAADATTPSGAEEPAVIAEQAAPVAEIQPNFEAQPTVSTQIVEQDELLLRARKAFWDKNFSGAIEDYQALIAREPNNPDMHGELGNVYYTLNDYPNASNHYYRAAELLIQRGQVNHARQLVAPITAMQRDMGERLQERLQTR